MAGLREFAGDGLFTAYSDEPSWQLAHDLLRPAFTREAMLRYHPVMLAAASELFDSWDAREAPVDVSADMTKRTLETISRAAFSLDFGSFNRQDPHPFVPAMVAALQASQRKGVLNTMPGSGLLARRIDRRNAHHRQYVDSLIDGIIAARRHPRDRPRRGADLRAGSEVPSPPARPGRGPAPLADRPRLHPHPEHGHRDRRALPDANAGLGDCHPPAHPP